MLQRPFPALLEQSNAPRCLKAYTESNTYNQCSVKIEQLLAGHLTKPPSERWNRVTPHDALPSL